MIINDLWGQIRIEPKYEKIINCKEFQELKNKRQLGLNCNPNAIHTRYQHSIGVYYLACKLIEICKQKFFDILDITKEDEEAIKCMALVHDIGHGCFSHVSEKFLEGTHEERTIDILMDLNSEVHKAIIDEFGESVLKKIVNLIKIKEDIKDNKITNNDNDLTLIISKLLSGGIDIDRIDYMFRDSKHVNGDNNNFFNILESIDLECIDDSLEVVFDENAEYAIANFFNKRFELYDSIYLTIDTMILEMIFGKFLEAMKIKINWNTSEIEMENLFRKYLNSENEIIRRYAKLLNDRKLDNNFVLKEINSKESFESYKFKLINYIPELMGYPECLFEAFAKISIYNKDNKVFINKGGLIQDISDTSKILNSELKKQKYVIGVDLYLLKKRLEKNNVDVNKIREIIKKVKEVTSPQIEQEKKYIFSIDSINPLEEFKIIRDRLKLVNPEYIENYDVYYDKDDILSSQRINVRKRSSKIMEWTCKKPVKDKTSISKRNEENFNSLDDVLKFLRTSWKIDISSLEEKITLKVSRVKYDIKYGNGLFEIVFDKMTPIYKGNKYEPKYMIECELKKGNSAGLFLIDKIIKQYSFIEECNLSKKEIAMMEIEKKINDTELNEIEKRKSLNLVD